MSADEERFIARIDPGGEGGVESLLALPAGLDVWERHDDHLVVRAAGPELAELERRRLAQVRWRIPEREFVERAGAASSDPSRPQSDPEVNSDEPDR